MMRLVAAAVLLVVAVTVEAQDQSPPKIRSGVEVVAIDVQVVDKNGFAFPGLGPDDFEVWIDGDRRRVATVDIVKHVGPQSTRTASTGRDDPEGGSTAPAPTGRLFIVAVDEHSFSARAAQAAMDAVRRFVEGLRPDDLVGLYAYPTGTAHVDLTTKHQAVLDKLGTIVGLFDPPRAEFHLSLTEIGDISSGDSVALQRAIARECRPNDRDCGKRLAIEAQSTATFYEMQVAQSLGGLRPLFHGLSAIPQRKTVVLVSGGLLASERPGGRPNMGSELQRVGEEAAAANVNLFVLHMDSSFLDAFSKGVAVPVSLMADSSMAARGLEMVAGAAGGAVVRIEGTAPDRALERLLRETSVYYLLGVEVDGPDRDGKLHTIRVRVKQRGAVVRSRTSVVIPRAGG